jgi:hypothetical protein
MRHIVSILVLSLFFSLTTGHVCLADGGLILSPAYIEVDLSETPRTQRVIHLVNREKDTKRVTLGLDYQGDASVLTRENIIRLYGKEFLIAPMEEVDMFIDISDSDLLPAGSYSVELNVDVASKESDKKPPQNTIKTGMKVSILLLKPGPNVQPRFSVEGIGFLSGGLRHMFFLPRETVVLIRNSGNIASRPYGVVLILDSLGRQIYKGYLNDDSTIIRPQQVKEISLVINKTDFRLPFSVHTIFINGYDERRKNPFRYEKSYLAVHPLGLTILGLIGMVICVRIIVGRKRARRTYA